MEAPNRPALLAFDKYSNPVQGELAPIPADVRGKLGTAGASTRNDGRLRLTVPSP